MELSDNIYEICAEILGQYKKALNDSGHYASGKLANTAKAVIKWDGKVFELSFNLQDYWKYLELGTKPHFPPMSAIEEWIKVKRIVPTARSGKVPTTKQLAFQIARGISKNGTKPAHTLQKTIDGSDTLIQKIVDELLNQTEKQIDEEINDKL